MDTNKNREWTRMNSRKEAQKAQKGLAKSAVSRRSGAKT
jgi:hypothetical protein